MDTYCFKKVKSSSILILIERDDGTKKETNFGENNNASVSLRRE